MPRSPQPYRTPTLRTLGSVHELTLGGVGHGSGGHISKSGMGTDGGGAKKWCVTTGGHHHH